MHLQPSYIFGSSTRRGWKWNRNNFKNENKQPQPKHDGRGQNVEAE